jgi:DNA-binding MarR family transcriptional regulator
MSTTTLPRARRTRHGEQTLASNSQVAERVRHPDLRTLMERMPLWRRPGFLVRRLHQIHGALFAEECAGFDITPVQYAVLTTLSLRPDCDQNTLAQEVGLDRTNAADVLRRLARQGLVARHPGAQDRRRMLAHLTPRGAAVAEAMQSAMVRAQQRLIAALDSAEREQFLATLLKLVDATNGSGRAALRPARRGAATED